MSDIIQNELTKINELIQLDLNFKIYKIFKDKGYKFNSIIYLYDSILEDLIKSRSYYENHMFYKIFININFIFNIKTKINKLDKLIEGQRLLIIEEFKTQLKYENDNDCKQDIKIELTKQGLK